EIWRPHEQWVVAVSLLPETEADPATLRDHGLVFIEGRDILSCPATPSEPEPWAKLAERTSCRPHTLDELPGDFSFLHFDAQGALTSVRACGGRVPLYLWQGSGRAAVATRMHYLIRHAGAAPRLDAMVCGIWATGFPLLPDARSPIADVYILPRGRTARLRRSGGFHITPYWDPRPDRLPIPPAGLQEEHGRRLRALLLSYLERELDARGANLLTLSGGADSASLAALAAGTLGKTISTWSMLPPPGPALDLEASYISPLLRSLRVKNQFRVHCQLGDRVDMQAQSPFAAMPIPHPALCALPGLLGKQPIRVLFGGEMADELVGSRNFTLPDWLTHTSLRRLLTAPGAWPRGYRDPAAWVKARWAHLRRNPPVPAPARLRAFSPARLQEEYRDWLGGHIRRAAADRRPLRFLALRCELDGVLPMNWEACSALGIRRAWPFFHREILDLAFTCHPCELIGPGDKRLLRRALVNDVPAHNLQRTDAGHWGAAIRGAPPARHGPLPDALHAVVDPAWLQPHGQAPKPMDEADALGIEFLRIFALRAHACAKPQTPTCATTAAGAGIP
ncbi:MAG: asparagine synthase-related protein, partial [Salinisphaera sp.]|nr:asparagine synthase-related protein [Salinisphaera sp.]